MTVTDRLPAASDPAGHREAAGKPEFRHYPRNPWTGIHAGREFLYDLRHPMLFHRRVIAGLRGDNPRVGKEQRLLGLALMIVGGLNILVGMAMVVRGVGWH